MNVEIEIADREYDVEVTHFYAGEAPTREEPGAGAEIEFEEVVKVWESGKVVEKISLGDFLAIFAEWQVIPPGQAMQRLEEHCIVQLIQQMEADFDDRDV